MALNKSPLHYQVTLAATYTNIRAKTPCHSLKIYQDGTRDLAFNYKLPDDGFVTVYTTQAGDPIVLLGHGRGGILGRPPGYNGYNAILQIQEPPDTAADATNSEGGDIMIQIQATDGSQPTVDVVESVSEL